VIGVLDEDVSIDAGRLLQVATLMACDSGVQVVLHTEAAVRLK
jgi:hypothetical protein